MTLSVVRNWFNKLSIAERDLPLLIVEGYVYTPRQALAEVQRNTPIGARLQALIESGRFGTTPEEEIALAKHRLTQILKKYPPEMPVAATLGRAYTAQEMLKEIEAGTIVGSQWISAETEKMRRIVAIR